jgi:hypothetical protein
VTDDYFLNQREQETGRTAYEYIRDHLGYRFQLKEATIPILISRSDQASITIKLKNFGFAPLINKRPVYLVLIDEKNQPVEYLTESDPRKWLPADASPDGMYTIEHSVHFNNSFSPGIYKVGIWMPDESEELKYNTDYAIRLANGDMEYWQDQDKRYLVNIVGSLQLR